MNPAHAHLPLHRRRINLEKPTHAWREGVEPLHAR
jgi:hypothetical protein